MLGRLHVLTDARPGRDAMAVAGAALAAGAPVLQVRVPAGGDDRALFDFATEIFALCRRYKAMCLINDRVDIALAVGADGVHLGAGDLPVRVARRLLGPAAIIGATVRDRDSARMALSAGADYVGVGPCYQTTTKGGLPPPLGPAAIEAVVPVGLPVIAIGGVTVGRVADLMAVGAHGIAVVGAVSAASDPGHVTRELLLATRRGLGRV